MSFISGNLDVPWFKPDAQFIIHQIAYIDVAQINQFFEFQQGQFIFI